MHKADPHELIRRHILNTVGTPLKDNPGTMLPKDDKIAEWALCEIAEQLRVQNQFLNQIAIHLSRPNFGK